MSNASRLLAAASLSAAIWAAVPASAQTYSFNFGPTLSGQFTASSTLTGTGYAITGVSGTFMGTPITGIIANPYSPSMAYYLTRTGAVVSTMPTSAMTNAYYVFDNLLLPGNTFDTGGLFFETSTTLVNLYYDSGSFQVAYSPIGFDGLGTTVPVSGSVMPVVPEPAIWAMMILGFGVVGATMRRRPQVTTRVSYTA